MDILHLLYPRKCVLCCDILSGGLRDLCPKCTVTQPEYTRSRFKIPFTSGQLALWYYDILPRNSLLRYKFGGKRHYAKSYARLLAAKLGELDCDKFDLITWVPISRRRKMKRGFDQVELLAHALSRETGIPAVKCLKKIRHTPAQSFIHGLAQRRANVNNAYKAIHISDFAQKRILLLDDIITTGATMSECAKALTIAGAKDITALAVAAARSQK